MEFQNVKMSKHEWDMFAAYFLFDVDCTIREGGNVEALINDEDDSMFAVYDTVTGNALIRKEHLNLYHGQSE